MMNIDTKKLAFQSGLIFFLISEKQFDLSIIFKRMKLLKVRSIEDSFGLLSTKILLAVFHVAY